MFFPTLDLFACGHICGRLHSAFGYMANRICEMFYFEVAAFQVSSLSFGRHTFHYLTLYAVFDIFLFLKKAAVTHVNLLVVYEIMRFVSRKKLK